jgi:hypothetical protein
MVSERLSDSHQWFGDVSTDFVTGRGEVGCVISAASILSWLRRHDGIIRWPGLNSRVPNIGAMDCAMQTILPMPSGM